MQSEIIRRPGEPTMRDFEAVLNALSGGLGPWARRHDPDSFDRQYREFLRRYRIRNQRNTGDTITL